MGNTTTVRETKQGKVAVRAATRASTTKNPIKAWQQAAGAVFRDAPAARLKGCPRSAFLGLCEAGFVVGVDPTEDGTYTRSEHNKRHAIDAVEQLKLDASFATEKGGKTRLWKAVRGKNKKAHNGQMDVVIALWNAKLIRGS